jgi:hypothetical protein
MGSFTHCYLAKASFVFFCQSPSCRNLKRESLPESLGEVAAARAAQRLCESPEQVTTSEGLPSGGGV